jgi:hypothetical protein
MCKSTVSEMFVIFLNREPMLPNLGFYYFYNSRATSVYFGLANTGTYSKQCTDQQFLRFLQEKANPRDTSS